MEKRRMYQIAAAMVAAMSLSPLAADAFGFGHFGRGGGMGLIVLLLLVVAVVAIISVAARGDRFR